MKIDLHMHSTVSDGTDSPEILLNKVRLTKKDADHEISVFSLTDHDDCLGTSLITPLLCPDDPMFIPGVEISPKKENRKFHILGYAYDISTPAIIRLTKKTHAFRIKKLLIRLDFLEKEYGFIFPDKEHDALLRLPNPGKPHLGNLMVKYGYANSKNEAIANYINQCKAPTEYVTPEEAIPAILSSGGIPVLAHGIYGSGTQYFDEQELAYRIDYLKELGLMGIECYYSRYEAYEQNLTSKLCSKAGLLATAGSDYHGTNKTVSIGENHLEDAETDPRVMDFLALCRKKIRAVRE